MTTSVRTAMICAFIINKADVSDYGSRAVKCGRPAGSKLAEVEWMKERTGEWAVLLFDEVMAELDVHRRADLLKYVNKEQQVLFTTTDMGSFAPEFIEEAEIWHVRSGVVTSGRIKGKT